MISDFFTCMLIIYGCYCLYVSSTEYVSKTLKYFTNTIDSITRSLTTIALSLSNLSNELTRFSESARGHTTRVDETNKHLLIAMYVMLIGYFMMIFKIDLNMVMSTFRAFWPTLHRLGIAYIMSPNQFNNQMPNILSEELANMMRRNTQNVSATNNTNNSNNNISTDFRSTNEHFDDNSSDFEEIVMRPTNTSNVLYNDQTTATNFSHTNDESLNEALNEELNEALHEEIFEIRSTE